MDERSRKIMNSYYSDRLKKYGPTKESLVYRSEDQQLKRYALLAAVEPISKDSSILDVGCGFGYFCDYLRKYNWTGEYTGIDINQDIIDEAKKRLPKDSFICVDILEETFDKKYDYVFCGATVQHRPKHVDPIIYLQNMVKKMFSCSMKAVAFDVFSGRAEFFKEDNLYIAPSDLLNFCFSLTGRVMLRNDSRPYEMMMYLYKNTDKDEFNIYKKWIAPEPIIT